MSVKPVGDVFAYQGKDGFYKNAEGVTIIGGGGSIVQVASLLIGRSQGRLFLCETAERFPHVPG